MGDYFNIALAKSPMNWAIVFVVATIWLFFFHIIMQAFDAMKQGPQTAFSAAPGQVSSPTAAANFTAGSSMADSLTVNALQASLSSWGFDGQSSGQWVDDYEARYAMDGQVYGT